MKITEYSIYTSKIKKTLCIASVSDLHARNPKNVISALHSLSPDIILLPGDILEVANEFMAERNIFALQFLKEASNVAPCYYCFGNHEIYYSHTKHEKNRIPNPILFDEIIQTIKGYGIHIINDSYEQLCISPSETIYIGGLVCGRDMNPAINKPDVDFDFLDRFSSLDSIKILLCHYPQYYIKYLKDRDFDIILSGHAHGGQWRFFGKGIYSPHQGLFPKYTSGIHFDRLIISTGAVNNSKPIPRFFNPPEILKINIIPKEETL